jgi:hypothetical protein
MLVFFENKKYRAMLLSAAAAAAGTATSEKQSLLLLIKKGIGTVNSKVHPKQQRLKSSRTSSIAHVDQRA